jgi:hypothetical protein
MICHHVCRSSSCYQLSHSINAIDIMFAVDTSAVQLVVVCQVIA